MTETLTIRNFGPIKDATIDIRKVTVLIGEQATGKSTLAKLLAVCRYFSYITEFDYFEKEGSAFSWGLIAWGLDEYLGKGTYIYYSCLHYDVECKAIKAPFDPHVENEINEKTYDVELKLLPKSAEFRNLLDELKKLNKGMDYYSFSETPPTFFKNNVAAVMDNPFYLPAERGLQSLFSLGKSSIQNLSDSLFSQFANLDSMSKRFKEETEIAPLGIFYRNDEGRGYVKKKGNEQYYSLSNGATGFQSAIPVVLAVRYYSIFRKKKKTFLLEEPELSLFPLAQSRVVNYLIENVNEYSHAFFLTTHSPYILASLNNLMSAHNVGRLDAKSTNEVIPEKYWLNPDDVSAYLMLPDGTCEDIMDREENMIEADKIDTISGVLNREFDKLIDIEMAFDEKHK